MAWTRVTGMRIALVVAVALAAARFGGCSYLELADARSVDYRLLQRGARAGSSDVVIVAVDDASLETYGRWPWRRSVVARLLDAITAAGAAVVGFDMVQSERTTAGGSEGLPERIDGVDEATWSIVRRELMRRPDDDQVLAAAVRQSGRVVLGYFFDFARQAQPGPVLEVSTFNLVQRGGNGRGGERRLPKAESATVNLPELRAAARDVGYFNFLPDDLDGLYRRVPLAVRFGDEIAVPLSLAMLRTYRPEQPLAIKFAEFGVESVRLGSVSIPVAEDGQMLINFRGPGKAFKYIAAADVLAGRFDPAALQGKLVLVGVTATAVADVRATPFDGVLPGVEIHANVLDNVLRQDFVQQPKWIVLVEIAAILLVTAMLGAVLQHARGVIGSLVAVGLAAAYLVSSQWLFEAHGLPLSLLYPLLAIGLTYTAIVVQHYAVAERGRRQIRNAFEMYLTPAVARLVSQKPEMLSLGGETRELTVLFSDVRGFTTISEQLQDQPQALTALLNEFLGAMTDVIFAHGGTLDKYVGDEIMALWGAPVPQPDHAARACQAALDMIARLAVLNQQWTQRGWPALDIGVGINSGPMVVGNMGSRRRLSYTVIGDNVNLGARLEGLNKLYGSHIVASESTIAASGGLVVRELDLVRVKGKLQGVRIYEVLGAAAERVRWQPLITRFESGLRAYREQRWQEAAAAFSAVLEERPGDGPARLYLGRARAMVESPPPPDWDGVTVMEVK
ncbi:MAG: adenylate/guanylate cyclase domain-containing protein [Deltaproteobacteria bacterium]|nr:adenylate/guanylate cyclase domain-containing protein [Deltaproteobacteria bacterium]